MKKDEGHLSIIGKKNQEDSDVYSSGNALKSHQGDAV